MTPHHWPICLLRIKEHFPLRRMFFAIAFVWSGLVAGPSVHAAFSVTSVTATFEGVDPGVRVQILRDGTWITATAGEYNFSTTSPGYPSGDIVGFCIDIRQSAPSGSATFTVA